MKESNRGWDEQLHEDEVSQWTKFIEFTLTLEPISVPRTVRPRFGVSCTLVTFCDASLAASGTVIYARWECKDLWDCHSIDSRLIVAKSRVAPSKGTSIPRLELQAVVQATRVTNRIKGNRLEVQKYGHFNGL